MPEGFCPICGAPNCTRKHKYGAVGWLSIAAFVVVWDFLAEDSLSAAFGRGNRTHRPLVILAYATTTAHLFGYLPQRYDPFHRLIERKPW